RSRRSCSFTFANRARIDRAFVLCILRAVFLALLAPPYNPGHAPSLSSMRWILPFSALLSVSAACSSASSTGKDDSGIGDAPAGNDASGMKDQKAPPMDAAPCSPKDLTGYQPPAFVPPVPQQGACTSMDIQQFYALCVGEQASPSACQAWTQLHKT